MSTKTLTLDDLDQSEGAETVHFGWRDRSFEIDLAQANTDKLEKVLTPFMNVAREVVRRAPATSQAAQVREWAKSRGIEVPAKGRIPASITEQYEAEQEV